MPSPQVFAPNGANNSMVPDKPRDYYNYPLTFATLTIAPAAGSVQSQNINISAASDFYLTAITQISVADGTDAPTEDTRVLPLVNILLTDTGSGRQLMNAATPLSLITGSGEWPHRLLMPRFFARNSNIQVTLTNVDANNAYASIFLNFEGFVIYQ